MKRKWESEQLVLSIQYASTLLYIGYLKNNQLKPIYFVSLIRYMNAEFSKEQNSIPPFLDK